MPVFNAHLPAKRFSSAQKRDLGNALNQSLVQGLGIPAGDRFIMLQEHGEDELFIDPDFMDIHRGPDAVIITVLFGAHRPLSDKHKVVKEIGERASHALGISSDSIFIVLIPVPNENFSFGRGELQLAGTAAKW